MKRDAPHDCPRIEALSLMIDDAICGGARREIEAHAASCPICGATLRDFGELRSRRGWLPVRRGAGQFQTRDLGGQSSLASR